MSQCHWEWTTLGEVSRISSGGTPSRTNPSYWEGQIPWVTTGLVNFNLINRAEEYISEEGLKNSAAKIFPAGTLLMALYGQGVTRGKVAMLGFDAATNQACASIMPIPEMKPLFLFYYLQGQYEAIRNIGHGGNQQNLSGQLIKEIPVPLPSIKEQERIAQMLWMWDRTIDRIERLIAAKQERRTWLMQELLTGKQRLPGFDEPWHTVHLGDVFTNRIETNFLDLPLVAITGNGGVVSRDDLVRRDTSSQDKSRYLRICPGDIGYNTMRMWQGVCGFSTLEGIVSPAYTIATPKDYIDGAFMALLFKSPHVVHLFHRHSQGLVDDTLNLKWRHFAEIKVTIPKKKEQQAIAAVFRTNDSELDLLRQQLDALRVQKKGLMQQLLTGKIRVKV
jgi:type I restriction enzyme S subunit